MQQPNSTLTTTTALPAKSFACLGKIFCRQEHFFNLVVTLNFSGLYLHVYLCVLCQLVAFTQSHAFCTLILAVGWAQGLTLLVVAKSFRAEETSRRSAKQRRKLQLKFLSKYKHAVEHL